MEKATKNKTKIEGKVRSCIFFPVYKRMRYGALLQDKQSGLLGSTDITRIRSILSGGGGLFDLTWEDFSSALSFFHAK